MNWSILPPANVEYLDKTLLDSKGLLRVLPYAEYVRIPLHHLQLWAVQKGVYTFPTTELIEWLRGRIAGRKAIEICAGNGAVGRALGIVSTDSYIQTKPEMIAYYNALGQHPILPPGDVYEYEASEAVDVLRPEVVIATYATQKYMKGDEGPPFIGSSVYGVDELAILPKVRSYICVGNDTSHGDKRILSLPHLIHRHEWIVTRAADQGLNCIMEWAK